MKIAIVEVGPQGHFTLVETVTQIFNVDISNSITIFTHERGKKICDYLANEQVSIKSLQQNENLTDFLSSAKDFDHVFIITLEAVSKDSYRNNVDFLKSEFNGRIHLFIHNVDFWFGNTFFKRLKNIIFYSKNLQTLGYQVKLRLIYPALNQRILEKVKKSKGKFIALSEPIKTEIENYINPERIDVLPFSLYDENLTDRSTSNKKLLVCLPGGVSNERRDYVSILKLILEDSTHFFAENIAWDFLGRISTEEGGNQIYELVQQAISAGHEIHLYPDKFIPFDEYHARLAQADIMICNLHLQQGASSFYGKSKESGIIFTMIKAAKPGLLLKDYAVGDAMQSAILRFTTYQAALEQLKNLVFNKNALIELKKNAVFESQKYSPEEVYKKWQENNSRHSK